MEVVIGPSPPIVIYGRAMDLKGQRGRERQETKKPFLQVMHHILRDTLDSR